MGSQDVRPALRQVFDEIRDLKMHPLVSQLACALESGSDEELLEVADRLSCDFAGEDMTLGFARLSAALDAAA